MKSDDHAAESIPRSTCEFEPKPISLYHFITSSLHHVLSPHLHMPNQMLVNPMVGVVHETFLGLLQLV